MDGGGLLNAGWADYIKGGWRWWLDEEGRCGWRWRVPEVGGWRGQNGGWSEGVGKLKVRMEG